MVIRLAGMSYPQFFSADRPRWRLSRTVASGKPTVVNCSTPEVIPVTSSSTSIRLASMPYTAALNVL